MKLSMFKLGLGTSVALMLAACQTTQEYQYNSIEILHEQACIKADKTTWAHCTQVFADNACYHAGLGTYLNPKATAGQNAKVVASFGTSTDTVIIGCKVLPDTEEQ